METLHRRCAGLDVHQKEIVACRRIASGGKVRSELGRFSTTTQGLLALSAWLAETRITHGTMEATGVYWKPVSRAAPRLQPGSRQRLAHPQRAGPQRATPTTRP